MTDLTMQTGRKTPVVPETKPVEIGQRVDDVSHMRE